ncbi:MAG: methylated-DNA--[Oscillospiraceae bacterium]|nr:methylated-DNA--[protein]-cysteine S-methyltransferase [Oscillospiraceae bacterium]
MYWVCFYDSPLGILGLAADSAGLRALWFDVPPGIPFTLLPGPEAHPVLTRAARWLDGYFAGLDPDFRDIPLAPEGTPFQRLVWELLLQTPRGQSVTYGELAREAARRLGKPRMSAQAIGQAVGANPIPILIPCHRCLAAGNRLGGYAFGPERKRKLLELEEIGYTDKKTL